MSKWLNGRLKSDPSVKHDLFATEEQAIRALARVLADHKQQGRTVKEKWVGPQLRYEVEDSAGFVAVHWLSDADDEG